MKNHYPDDKEIERTIGINRLFNIKNGEELTRLYSMSDFNLLKCVLKKFIKVSINEFDINPLYGVSLPGYTWQCKMKQSDIKLQTVQDNDKILPLEYNIRAGISSVMGDRNVISDDKKKIKYLDAIISTDIIGVNIYLMMKLNLTENYS